MSPSTANGAKQQLTQAKHSCPPLILPKIWHQKWFLSSRQSRQHQIPVQLNSEQWKKMLEVCRYFILSYLCVWFRFLAFCISRFDGLVSSHYSHETRTRSLYLKLTHRYPCEDKQSDASGHPKEDVPQSAQEQTCEQRVAAPHHVTPAALTITHKTWWTLFCFIYYGHEAFHMGTNKTRECAFPFIPNRAAKGA